MNQLEVGSILKEQSVLKTEVQDENTTRNKSFPHIVSKESFEQLIMNANDLQTPRLPYQTSSDSSEFSDSPSPLESQPQRASVIQSAPLRKKSENRHPMVRQRSIDESIITDIPLRKDESSKEEGHKHPYASMVSTMSFDNSKLDSQKYKSRSLEYYSGLNKSKSLDMPDSSYSINQSSSLPKQFTKHNSFTQDEEAAMRYFQGLHITTNSPNFSYSNIHHTSRGLFDSRDATSRESNRPRDIPRHKMSHDISLDSNFSDSPINGSPINTMTPNNPLRLISEPVTGTQTPPHGVLGLTQPELPGIQHFSRSYENTQAIQHKYSQRKAYSLNTAPYDKREKNLRRILSEEIVPEHLENQQKRSLLLEKHAPLPHQSHMRRAASYDLAAYVRHRKLNQNEKISGSVGNFHTKSQSHQNNHHSPQTSKIIFPEHDNVKDYKSIFVKPIDDESTHALNVMENSSFFANHLSQNSLDLVNYVSNSIKGYQFYDDEKKRKVLDSPSSRPKMTKLQQQNSQDLLIGPYVYNPTVDDEIAVCVTGLLTLPGSNEKRYPISVGELRRRIAPPEYLNKVDMISYVRLAKTSARELLEKHAIRPKHHSRKSKHSVISKMCEAECTELANGIKTLGEAYFPKDWLAQQAVSEEMKNVEANRTEQKLKEKLKKVSTTKSVLTELSSLIESTKTDDAMQNYNLATHSYGLQNLTNNIELISSLLDSQSTEILRTLESTNETSPSSKLLTNPNSQTQQLLTNQNSQTQQRLTNQNSFSKQMSVDQIDSMELDEHSNSEQKPNV